MSVLHNNGKHINHTFDCFHYGLADSRDSCQDSLLQALRRWVVSTAFHRPILGGWVGGGFRVDGGGGGTSSVCVRVVGYVAM